MEENSHGVRVRSTKEFKLKDKVGRHYQILKLSDFGFIPEVLIIEKVEGRSSTMIVRAVLTPEAIEEEDAMLKKLKVTPKENGRKNIKKPPTSS